MELDGAGGVRVEVERHGLVDLGSEESLHSGAEGPHSEDRPRK